VANFSPVQQEASDYAVQFVAKPWLHKPNLLIWAVTGAGKTEILFHAINHCLLLNRAVLIVSPRKEVVLELTSRLQKVFPQEKIVSLHGESWQKGEISRLVVATTHQALNLYRYFDLVVIDEVDAFPYPNSPMLHQAVAQARLPNGQMIYLTATPPKNLLQQVRQGSAELIKIPCRHHGYPLVVPQVKIDKRIQKQIEDHILPREMRRFIDHLVQKDRQGFLFVPRIEWISPIVEMIDQYMDQRKQVEGVYANDPDRNKKIEAFRERKIRLLVTTTILERGVTMPSIDCFVCQADAGVFDESTLVQIAGRAGRSSHDPNGLVIYFSQSRTRAMVDAIKQIEGMNRIARQKGYINDHGKAKRHGLLHRVITYWMNGR